MKSENFIAQFASTTDTDKRLMMPSWVAKLSALPNFYVNPADDGVATFRSLLVCQRST
jgi:hypothetical protein